LHTPLMSATNSIHGIVLVGALLIGVTAHTVVGYILAFVAAVFAAANVVGGYVVTERMLKMFRRRAPEALPHAAPEALPQASPGGPEALNGHRGLRGLLRKTSKPQSGDAA
jgi:NAD(P) transhydrogenase subunit alpha